MMWERAQARFLLRWRFVPGRGRSMPSKKGGCPCSSEGEQAEICHRQSGDRAGYCTGSDGGTACSDRIAFIGGSSGNMNEIIRLLLDKNPKVRIVINCITLETVTEAMNAIRDFSLTDVDIVQLSAARSKSIGRYHMMMGENPIYIISCSGRGEEI